MKFSMKKGAIEIQFNWVFVLIVGALILVFFINISNVQRRNADQQLAFELLSKVDLIMSGALTIPQTGQVFDMPNLPFNIECNRISTLGVSRQFPDKVVFGPDTLQGRQLVVYSQNWNVPYKIANFLYMTTSNVRYVIVSGPDVQVAVDFYESLPDNITKEVAVINDAGFTDQNNYRVRLIFLSEIHAKTNTKELPEFLKKMPDNAVSGVYINEDEQFVQYYEKEDFGGEKKLVLKGAPIKIYKQPMIIGAVFSADKDEFNCSVTKAFEKLHYVSEVYAEKETALNQEYVDSYLDECKDPITRAPSKVEAIAEAALERDVTTIQLTESEVMSRNNNALRASCAPIY